jgi:cyclic pyranopterin phosphate synthase
MVDVSSKPATRRVAVARALVHMQPATLALIRGDRVAKGNVLQVAQLAGIMAAKRTSELIPLCHPVTLTDIDVRLAVDARRGGVAVEATARTVGPTGVEMEALVAAGVAALTVYDMCKAADRGMTIDAVRLVHKSGGRSGVYRRPGEAR